MRMRTERAASLDCGPSPAIRFRSRSHNENGTAAQPPRACAASMCTAAARSALLLYHIMFTRSGNNLSLGRLVFLQMTFFVCFVSDSRVAAGLMRGAATAVNT